MTQLLRALPFGVNFVETEVGFLIVLVLLIILLSFLKVKFMWGGFALVVYGGRKAINKKGDQANEMSLEPSDSKVLPKITVRGSVPYLIIVVGLVAIVLDLLKNGPSAYAEAATRTKNFAEGAKAVSETNVQSPKDISNALEGVRVHALVNSDLEKPMASLQSDARLMNDQAINEGVASMQKEIDSVKSIDAAKLLASHLRKRLKEVPEPARHKWGANHQLFEDFVILTTRAQILGEDIQQRLEH